MIFGFLIIGLAERYLDIPKIIKSELLFYFCILQYKYMYLAVINDQIHVLSVKKFWSLQGTLAKESAATIIFVYMLLY